MYYGTVIDSLAVLIKGKDGDESQSMAKNGEGW